MRHRGYPRVTPAPLPACLALAAGLLLPAPAPAQIVAGQTDTFEGGTTQNWTNGQGGQNISVQTGGPGGAADHFLQVGADGGGAFGRLTTFNRSQWLGNYIAAGVTSIAMDLKNLGTTPLTIRIAYKEGVGTQVGYSSIGFALPADGQWHHAVFPLNDASMTPVAPVGTPPPSQPFSTLIAGQEREMRILHAVQASVTGDNIASQVGVDNIQAVPEPASLALVGAAAALAGPCLWRRRPRRTAANRRA